MRVIYFVHYCVEDFLHNSELTKNLKKMFTVDLESRKISLKGVRK